MGRYNKKNAYVVISQDEAIRLTFYTHPSSKIRKQKKEQKPNKDIFSSTKNNNKIFPNNFKHKISYFYC